MSDDRLLQLERRWRESGALADEVALLTQRQRQGRLDAERLALAACCGSEAARALVEAEPLRGEPLTRDWLQALRRRFGLAPIHQLDLAIARALAPHWRRELPDDPLVDALLEATERQLAEPGPEHLAALQAATERAPRDMIEQAKLRQCEEQQWTAIVCPHLYHFALGRAQLAAGLVAGQSDHLQMAELGYVAALLHGSSCRYLGLDLAGLRRTALGAMLSWALGHGDPR